MTLENLSKIGQLKPHETDSTELGRLLDAARRNLNDAHVETISLETRFDAAYKAIMQALTKTIGLPRERMTVLDALRRKRNQSDYTGEDIDEVSTEQCIQEADRLLVEVTEWLKEHRPDLIRDA